MASIELRSVCKTYDDHPGAVQDVSLRIDEGEFCVLVGPSGCGKTTMLRMIAGLEDITSGELLIDGRRVNDVPAARRGVAMVFQSYALFPHMTVHDNLAFGISLAGLPKAQIEQKVLEVARLLQLEPVLQRKPRALSGGQRQRVAIGRAIVREPRVFLFDEPLSNLDAGLRVQMRFEIAKLHREYGRASTVYVTHDQVEAMTLADRIVVLNSGEAVPRDGTVAQVGSPMDVYLRPSNRFVAGFIGSPRMNFIAAELMQANAGHATVRLAGGEVLQARVDAAALGAGEAVTIGVRPEHAGLGSNAQHLMRRVLWQERLGESTHVYFESPHGADPLIVKAGGHVDAGTGECLAVALPAAQLHVFDSAGRALPRLGEAA